MPTDWSLGVLSFPDHLMRRRGFEHSSSLPLIADKGGQGSGHLETSRAPRWLKLTHAGQREAETRRESIVSGTHATMQQQKDESCGLR